MFSFLTHNDLKVSRHVIPLSGLSPSFVPPGESSFRLVQVSDLHFYEYTESHYYQRVLDEIQKWAPHLIVSTGDLIHYGSDYIEQAGEFLSLLSAPYGKYAVLGNHDYADGKRSQAIRQMLESSGYHLLVNNHIGLEPRHGQSDTKLWLVGLDDYKYGKPDLTKALSGLPPLSQTKKKAPVIMLAHNPLHFDVVTQQADSPVDLVLSGHTHAGHFYLPFLKPIYRYVFKMKYRYGFYEKNKIKLYVTSGLGAAAFYMNFLSYKRAFPRFRYNAEPEIAVFDFIPEETQQHDGPTKRDN